MLTIVATPIGNLKDITLRALETLKSVDLIICEDTRVSSNFLNYYKIKKPLLPLNDFNEPRQIPNIISELKAGKNVALISDAGTPLISDPGYKLIRECTSQGIPLDSLPGPSSVIVAITLSGLPPDKFTFIGFLPDKPGHRQKLLENIKNSSQFLPSTYIIFISPHKLLKTLQEIRSIIGNIQLCLTKELTKLHQNISLKTASSHLQDLSSQKPKGEFVALFHLPGLRSSEPSG